MKKFALILVAAMLVGATAWTAYAAISGSAHDLSGLYTGGGPAGSQDQICVFCHAPHNAAVPSVGPLWNHAESAAGYTMYPGTAPGSDLQGAIGTEPNGISKLCLSCHDGTVAIDAYGGVAGTTSMTGNALIGTDLSNDHPISITYTTATAQADGELNDPATYILGGDFIVNSLDSDQIQCSTCHDVHNGGAAELVNYKLLVEDAAGSAICLACHAK